MNIDSEGEEVRVLREAYQRCNLTLHVGAGVSVGSGLPTWDKLVLAMYFMKTSEKRLHGWRPFPNYLYAISEYLLEKEAAPLEISARKLQKYFCGQNGFENASFVKSLHDTLYMPFVDELGIPEERLRENATLEAVRLLISNTRSTRAGRQGVRSVVSYNYDNLLEVALEGSDVVPVWKEGQIPEGAIPIYHVHGYVPFQGLDVAREQDLVFTEDQYHQVARDPYHWSNLVQIQSISGSVTLMVGLSLADRNMRRLLDAVSGAPVNTRTFAILEKPRFDVPPDSDLKEIHEKAKVH